jgi:hypothetical protein
VLVQIDEAGRDDEAGGVDRHASYEPVGADGSDGPPRDADVAHGIERRFRIHHPAVGDHDVETLAIIARRSQPRRKPEKRCADEDGDERRE